ncbi:MAG: Ppx/GppA phosphatase family protein [bacterium]|nr:Ppx/GppA phosphatase family protein [bacterium]MDE0351990.1 Ppx/GppA phosphatase family protein [bacterium]
MPRFAAVDIGTNSTRLLIAEVGRDGMADVERIEQVTGLGRDSTRSGRLTPESIGRTVRVLAGYGRRIGSAGVTRSRAVATAATRDAVNREEFLAAARQALGFRPDVIGGEEEADLCFRGATARHGDAGRMVVVDIGGGSTEVVTDQGGVSVNIGSIRLTERCLPTHPAASEHLAAARRTASEAMQPAGLTHRREALGTAGTWTTLAAIHQRLGRFDPTRVEGAGLSLTDLGGMVSRLGGLTLEEKRAIPGLDPLRAPVILGGAVIAETALRVLGLERITVTGYDILDGICLALADDTGLTLPT